MKNSKEYSPKIEKLLKSLKKEAAAVAMPTYTDPVDAIVYAFISSFTTEANASKLLKRIDGHFVDINDLRVSRPEEILEVFGEQSEQAAASTQAMTAVLNAIFEKFDKVSLNSLNEEGKRQARKDLEDIPGMTSFAAAYTFLTALGGHAVPLTDAMIQYLRQNELVHPEANPHEVESFLERQVSATEAYAFYAKLRAEAEGGSKPAARANVKTKKKAAKAAPKKSSVKKKTAKK
jgi:hypothetical protein